MNNTALPLEIQQLEKALDLTGFINEVEKLLATPLSAEGCTLADLQGASKDIWPNDGDRREDLKDLYNFKTVDKRKWLQNILLEDSEDEDCEAPITDEDLKILLKIHKYRRKCQKKYHTDISNSQYTYYAAGLLSEEDKFPEHQQRIRNLFGAKSGISDDFRDYCEKTDSRNRKRRADSCASALSFAEFPAEKEKLKRRPPSGKSAVKRAPSASTNPPSVTTMESPVFDTNLSSPIGAVRHDYLPTIQESACDQPTTDTFLTPSLPVFATMTTSTGGDPETEINEALLPSIKSDADTMVILSIPSPKTDDQQMLSEMGPSHIDTTINSVVLSSDDQVVGHSEEVHFGVTSSTSVNFSDYFAEPSTSEQIVVSSEIKNEETVGDSTPDIAPTPVPTVSTKTAKKSSKKSTKTTTTKVASVQSHSRTGVVGLSKCFIADATEEEIDQMRRKVWQKIAAEEVPKIYTEKYIFRKYRAIVAKDIAMWCQRKVEEKLNPQGASGSKAGKAGKSSAGTRNTRSNTAKGKAKTTPKKGK